MFKRLLMLMAIAAVLPLYSKIDNHRDSSSRKTAFHILCSTKPMLNWAKPTDSIQNFLYSKSQFELQFNYKRHMLGFGFNYNRRKTINYINNLPNTITQVNYSYAPYYAYRLCQHKRWKTYAGVGYLFSQRKYNSVVESPIENVRKDNLITEEGGQLFLRFNYRMTKHLSLELEMAFYSTRTRFETYEKYPLTPSMNFYNAIYQVNQTYSLPSNLWIKYSF